MAPCTHLTPFDEAIAGSGLRKNWVAEQVGVSPSTISRLLNGERTPSHDLARRLGLVLRRDPAELFPAAKWAEDDSRTTGNGRSAATGTTA